MRGYSPPKLVHAIELRREAAKIVARFEAQSRRLSLFASDGMLKARQSEGGSDGKRRATNAGARRGGLQECGGQHLFSEKTAVAGDQLCPTSICGYFPNLGSLLQPN